MNKLIVIGIVLLLIILAISIAYRLGDTSETWCRLTFGKWSEGGTVVGELRWKTQRGCSRPLLFGLIQRM